MGVESFVAETGSLAEVQRAAEQLLRTTEKQIELTRQQVGLEQQAERAVRRRGSSGSRDLIPIGEAQGVSAYRGFSLGTGERTQSGMLAPKTNIVETREGFSRMLNFEIAKMQQQARAEQAGQAFGLLAKTRDVKGTLELMRGDVNIGNLKDAAELTRDFTENRKGKFSAALGRAAGVALNAAPMVLAGATVAYTVKQLALDYVKDAVSSDAVKMSKRATQEFNQAFRNLSPGQRSALARTEAMGLHRATDVWQYQSNLSLEDKIAQEETMRGIAARNLSYLNDGGAIAAGILNDEFSNGIETAGARVRPTFKAGKIDQKIFQLKEAGADVQIVNANIRDAKRRYQIIKNAQEADDARAEEDPLYAANRRDIEHRMRAVDKMNAAARLDWSRY